MFKRGLLLLLFILAPAYAVVSLPWSTTFDCDEWSRCDSSDPDCDGVSASSTYCTSICGKLGTEITSAANYPYGGGGRGMRKYTFTGDDRATGSLTLYFDRPYSEMWVRWYMRWEAGYNWDPHLSYDKMFYWYYTGQDNAKHLGPILSFIGGPLGSGQLRLSSHHIGVQYNMNSYGWDTYFAGGPYDGVNRVSDGKWHYIEVHIKADTDGTNGIAEVWVDDDKPLDIANANFDRPKGWHSISIGHNQNSPGTDCQYVDYDDVAISTTGRIGPVGNAPSHFCGDGNCNPGEDCTCSDCACSWGICCNKVCVQPECDESTACDCVNPGTCNAYCDEPVEPVDSIYIFDESLVPGAVIYSADPMTISTNNPYSGTHSLEIIDDGRSNNRIQNMQLDVQGIDWRNAYLEFMINTATPQEYVAINLWGDGIKMSEQSTSLSGGSYEMIRFKMTGFAATQAEFGNFLTQFMVNADWAGQANYVDEVRITSRTCATGETEPCDGCVSLAELAEYMSLWKSSQGPTIADIMQSINAWRTGC